MENNTHPSKSADNINDESKCPFTGHSAGGGRKTVTGGRIN